MPFAVYVSLFPHLIAGPIVRYSYIEDQLRDLKTTLTWEDAWRGFHFFIWGLAEKVLIADNVAKGSDPLLARHHSLDLLTSWSAMLGYTYQILFDFSGYSCMAVGLALLLGFKLPQNFDSPYKAANPSDFWRRWHITLSDWLRDYLYFALGGSRGSMAKTARNLVITMFLGGLWHGAAWTFVVWGLFHGALLAGYHALNAYRLWPTSRFVARAVTFVAVIFGWVLFRSEDWGMVGSLLLAMTGQRGCSVPHLNRRFVAMLLFCFIWTNWGPNAWDLKMTPRRITAIALAVVFVWVVLVLGAPSPFLYFQF